MNKKVLIGLILCLLEFWILAYFYLDQQNDLIALQLQIPELVKECNQLEEENQHYEYLVEQAKAPQNQLKWMKEPDLQHLEYLCEGEADSFDQPQFDDE